eukprot:1158423-Pelagomonas_calceolata.AAC.7
MRYAADNSPQSSSAAEHGVSSAYVVFPFLFLSFSFMCLSLWLFFGWLRPATSRSAKRLGRRSPFVVTIVTIVDALHNRIFGRKVRIGNHPLALLPSRIPYGKEKESYVSQKAACIKERFLLEERKQSGRTTRPYNSTEIKGTPRKMRPVKTEIEKEPARSELKTTRSTHHIQKGQSCSSNQRTSTLFASVTKQH